MTYGYIILVTEQITTVFYCPSFATRDILFTKIVNRTFLLSRTKEKHIFLLLVEFL